MNVVSCDQRHAEAIGNIFNEAILNSTALYDDEPRSAETIAAWINSKQAASYPIIGLEGIDGRLMGFASYGSFRPWAGYRFTVEHSVYVDARFRGRGIGRTLLGLLIDEATRQGFHTMIGGIDGGNLASIELHKKFGFSHCATIRESGFKFDRWLDLHLYQLILGATGK
jgi:L-amino acid N-acyltransferase YncA